MNDSINASISKTSGSPDTTFSTTLVTWQKQHGRHSLPWQNTRDAYKIWLSEIMLQQTQVTTVIPYYLRFLESFPDIFSLASASPDEIMPYWSGLGYYSRARNLHKCAKIIAHDYHGQFPSHPQLLAQLPGIGPSTAAAIAVFSSGVKAAILDGNVIRVLSRIFGITDSPAKKEGKNKLWQLAHALLPETELESYTQGLMDLGATICLRHNPDCLRCPFSKRCVALSENKIDALPAKKTGKKIPEKQIIMLVLHANRQILFEKRPESGIWGGLYSLPEKEYLINEKNRPLTVIDDLRRIASSFGDIVAMDFSEPFVHMLSHLRLVITPCVIELSKQNIHPVDSTCFWYDLEKLDLAPIPAPVRKLLNVTFKQKRLSVLSQST